MDQAITTALSRREPLAFFVDLSKKPVHIAGLNHYIYVPELILSSQNDGEGQRIFKPVETLRALDYLVRLHQTNPGQTSQLKEIDEALDLGMNSSEIIQIYRAFEYLADHGGLNNQDKGYGTPNFASFTFGFPKFIPPYYSCKLARIVDLFKRK